jgi:hemoglobin
MSEPYLPPQGPPQGPPPDPAIYRALGEAGLTRLLQDFYLELGRSPIAAMFPQGEAALLEAGAKSALFFVGVCGGPPLYAQRIGPPRMRARHLPFAIDATARRHWLDCWERVLAQAPQRYGFPEAALPGFRAFLEGFSAWMVNTAPSQPDVKGV